MINPITSSHLPKRQILLICQLYVYSSCELCDDIEIICGRFQIFQGISYVQFITHTMIRIIVYHMNHYRVVNIRNTLYIIHIGKLL